MANGGEINLGQDGLNYEGNTFLSWYDSTNGADINSLTGGSTSGHILSSMAGAHLVLGIRGNDINDSISIVSGGGNYSTDSTFDTLVASFKGNGDTTLASGAVSMTPDGMITGSLGNISTIFNNRSDAKDAIIPRAVLRIAYISNSGKMLGFVRAPSTYTGIPALITSGSQEWIPDGFGSFLHWGAAGDGTTDDSSAIADALVSGLSIRNDRFQRFLISSTIPSINTDIVDWEGGVIVYDASLQNAPGIRLRKKTRFNQNEIPFVIKNVSFLTKNKNTRYGLLADYSNTFGDANNHSPTVIMSDCYFGPYTQTTNVGSGFSPVDQYFSVACAWFLDQCGVHLKTIYCSGQKNSVNTNQPVGTIGLKFGNASTSSRTYVRTIMSDIHCRALDVGIEFVGRFEGVKLSNAMVVSCNRGVVINPTDADGDGAIGYETLGIFISNSHFNCEKDCVYISGGAEIYLNNLECYGFRDTQEWNGIVLGEGKKFVRDFKVYGCTFSGGAGATNIRNGIRLNGRVDRGRIFDNFGIKLDAFCNNSNQVASKTVFVRDNNWVNKSGTDNSSANTQTTNNPKVKVAWSYS